MMFKLNTQVKVTGILENGMDHLNELIGSTGVVIGFDHDTPSGELGYNVLINGMEMLLFESELKEEN
jgi:hypothetical protein